MPLLSFFSRPAACLLVAAVVSAAGTLQAAEPVRMGCGIMTFDTVPGWGLDGEGKSQIGPTHGSVVIDSEGQIYTSSNIGIFVFSPDGTLVRRHLGDDYTSLHDMEIRTEEGRDVIYGARNAAGEGIKIDVATPPAVCSDSIRPSSGPGFVDTGSGKSASHSSSSAPKNCISEVSIN